VLRVSRQQRSRVRTVASRLGVEKPLRKVWEVARPDVRRDRVSTEFYRSALVGILSRDSNCVDVGAHRGDLLADIVRVAPEGTHCAFEPLPTFAAGIRERFPSVRVEEIALWNASGTNSFGHVVDEPALSSLRVSRAAHGTVEQLSVPTARLDDLIPSGRSIALIKVDVEGAERQVFEGASATIERWRPALYFEHHRAADAFGTSARDLFALLTDSFGYRVFDVRGNGPLDASAFEQAERRHVTNFLATP
jgi:FkbM family methyltransferase